MKTFIKPPLQKTETKIFDQKIYKKLVQSEREK